RGGDRAADRRLLEGEDTRGSTRVKGGRRLGVDGQLPDLGGGQSGIEGAPTLPAIGALEDAADPGSRVEAAHVEGGGRLGVDGESRAQEIGQAVVDGAPADPDVRALENAGARAAGVAAADRIPAGSPWVDGVGL